MHQRIQAAKTYVTTHRKQFTIAGAVGLGVVLVAVIILVAYNGTPKYAYQPINACDLLTPAKAQDLLGERVISVDTKAPVVSGNVATSKCSYTDTNPDTNNMMVAAVAIRSAVNNGGIAQNKTDFDTARSNNTVEDVKGLGESAYFNKVNGQLHILDGHKWIILSYGVGSAPETNTVDKAVELAQLVLEPPELPKF